MNRNRKQKQEKKHTPYANIYSGVIEMGRATKPYKPELNSKMADWVLSKEAKKKEKENTNAVQTLSQL